MTSSLLQLVLLLALSLAQGLLRGGLGVRRTACVGLSQQKRLWRGADLSQASRLGHDQATFMLSGTGDKEGGGKGNSPGKWLDTAKEYAVPLAVGAAVLVLAGSQAGNIHANAASMLDQAVTKISGMGPMGYLYFAAIYIAAEVLAIPVFPLTASSGYLFGVVPGTLTVLISATVAACISFCIGRTVLRGWASKLTNEWPKWKAIDGAIAKEGFKVILLLRLSPLLPFAVSNYLYGITSVDFVSFFAATFLGFAPGTIGIVYAGSAGKSLLAEGGSVPWYFAVAGVGLVIFMGQTLARIAGDAIKQMEEEQKGTKPPPPT
jgi:uncharacterized membrane protein YdjX (TVP38/TMEM64 family)